MFIHIPNILLHINTSADEIKILVKHVDLLRLRAADSGGLDVTPLKECTQLHLPQARYPSARIEKDMAVIHRKSLGAAEWS